MSWVVKFKDATVDFDDLSPDAFDRLASEETDVTWWAVYTFPGANSARLYRAIKECAVHAGIEPPPEPDNMRDAKALLEMLDVTTPIADAPVIDGFPQTPDAPGNGSTSGAPGASTGLEPSPELSPSASS